MLVCACAGDRPRFFWRKKAVYLEQRIMGQLPVACWKLWGSGRALPEISLWNSHTSQSRCHCLLFSPLCACLPPPETTTLSSSPQKYLSLHLFILFTACRRQLKEIKSNARPNVEKKTQSPILENQKALQIVS